MILIGNLGKDPEMTYTPSGVAVTKVSLATTERWTSKDGQKQEQTEWHNLVFWRRQAEVANQYLRKGSRIYLEGRLKYRQWEGQDGQTRYATDIEVQNFQFLSPRGEIGAGEVKSGQGASRSAGQSPGGGQKTEPGDTHYEPDNPNDGRDNFGSGDDSDLPF
ncbi:MAG: single-stranded DNA-binding protein [bacterium]